MTKISKIASTLNYFINCACSNNSVARQSTVVLRRAQRSVFQVKLCLPPHTPGPALPPPQRALK